MSSAPATPFTADQLTAHLARMKRWRIGAIPIFVSCAFLLVAALVLPIAIPPPSVLDNDTWWGLAMGAPPLLLFGVVVSRLLVLIRDIKAAAPRIRSVVEPRVSIAPKRDRAKSTGDVLLRDEDRASRCRPIGWVHLGPLHTSTGALADVDSGDCRRETVRGKTRSMPSFILEWRVIPGEDTVRQSPARARDEG